MKSHTLWVNFILLPGVMLGLGMGQFDFWGSEQDQMISAQADFNGDELDPLGTISNAVFPGDPPEPMDPDEALPIYMPLMLKYSIQRMVHIKEGEFLMGCDPDHNGGFPCSLSELPLHPVYLDAFFINRYEVTNFEYSLCVDSGVCKAPLYDYSYTRLKYYGTPRYDDFPVIWVTWYDAVTYCSWLGRRLPTEAEWEKAARGTQVLAYPWGDSLPNCNLANSFDNVTQDFCEGDTTEVGSHPDGASPYGVMDMGGNVWEWTNDWWYSYYYTDSPYENPPGPLTGDMKVLRGSSWYFDWYILRTARRFTWYPDSLHYTIGIRCALSLSDIVFEP